jgi:hypothetical protein
MAKTSGTYRGTKEYALVHVELITAAKYRGTITYQEIAKILGLPLRGNFMQSRVGRILGEISRDEVANGRPMLSAIAVGVGGEPGKGFFVLARELGRLQDNNEQAFWEKECDLVYDTWKVVLKST